MNYGSDLPFLAVLVPSVLSVGHWISDLLWRPPVITCHCATSGPVSGDTGWDASCRQQLRACESSAPGFLDRVASAALFLGVGFVVGVVFHACFSTGSRRPAGPTTPSIRWR